MVVLCVVAKSWVNCSEASFKENWLLCVLGITLQSIGIEGDKSDAAISYSRNKQNKLADYSSGYQIFERKSLCGSHYLALVSLVCIFPPFALSLHCKKTQLLIEGSEMAVLYSPWGAQGPRHNSQKISRWPLCKPGRTDMKCWNWGRGQGYLCFAFALTGPSGFLVRCPFCRLGNKKKKNLGMTKRPKSSQLSPSDTTKQLRNSWLLLIL